MSHLRDVRHARYVAIGDSFTEGKGDARPDGSLRGFADLLARSLRMALPEPVAYANLARPSVRIAEILRGQVPVAAAHQPDLVTVVAGVNDIIALRFDADRTATRIEALFQALRRGLPRAKILTATLPDTSSHSFVARVWRGRVETLDQAVMVAASRYGVEVTDLATQVRLTRDDLALDTVHPSSRGHARIAQAFADSLGIEFVEPAELNYRPVQGTRTTRVVRTVAGAPRFVARRLARGPLISAQPPKRADLVRL